MSKKYGSTWWGQQWLNSLTQIDYGNRLPRGRTYANTGRVRSVEIKGNQINAKVQGTQPSPYRVSINVPIFSPDEKKRLVDEVARNPAIVAQLLNRELPPELLAFAERQRIKVFPQSWKDFSMVCSCPDHAVPCKHLAAVIYTVANEVDKHPFMVFEFHDLDLVKALEGRRINIADKKTERITKVQNLMAKPLPPVKAQPIRKLGGKPLGKLLGKPPIALARPEPASQKEAQTGPVKTEVPQLDFSTIPADLGGSLLTLFKPNPLFYDKDFKEVVRKLYAGASKAARKLYQGDFVPRTLPVPIDLEMRLQLVFDEALVLKYLVSKDRKNTPKTLKGFQLDHLVQVLLSWSPEEVHRTHPTFRALVEVFNFSVMLAKQGAIMPQLIECGTGSYRIRWLPAVVAQEVRALFDKLSESLPPGMLVVHVGTDDYVQSKPEVLYTLCSLFIGFCMLETTGLDNHPLVQAFQFSAVGRPQRFENEDIAQLLQLWINNFYLTQKDLVPVVKVSDENGGFSVELLVEDRREALRPTVPLSQVLKGKDYEAVRYEVLKDVMLLADFFPRLAQIVEAQGALTLHFDPVKFVDVLLKMLPALGLLGINILLPKGLKHLVRPKASLLAKRSPGKDEGSFLSFADLMRFDWQIALGDQLIPVEEFEELVVNLNGIIKLRDQYVLVDEEELIKLFHKLEEPPKLDGMQALQALLSEEYEGVKIGLSPEAASLIRQFVHPEEVPLPDGLLAQLRPYQLSGYDWLLKNTRLGFGSLLADDMGLGKTLQVIATLLRFKEEDKLRKSKALVIVPTSLLTNWRKEIEKFAPSLRAAVYHGQRRSLDVADPDVIITTYGVARSEVDLLKKMEWYCVVIDEAQNIKNPNAEQTKCVKAIPAPVRIAMSGTPVENRLSEFWSIMDFANKGYLGSPKQFNDQFAKPIQREHDKVQAAVFKKITAPFMLRRLKSDKSIISDLPDKIENNQYASLTPEQAAVYQVVVKENMSQIFTEGEEEKRQGLVLKMITALKQVCNHPYQYLKKGSKSPADSGKVDMLLNILENIYQNGEKTLIFTQYQEMGELLSEFIASHFDKEVLFLHGGTSRPRRDEMVELFQNDPFADTFILSLKAGGTGLNLTAASNVIHFDLWWNPAVEAQATDRAYRIGQTKNVMVWRLITQGTFEEKIDEMIRVKKDLANLTVATGENWIGNLSNEDLRLLVSLP